MAEHFASDWLALREPVDHRARAGGLLEPLLTWWGVARARTGDQTLTVVDLGSGTGSNLRYLAPRLPGPQAWTLVDHDTALLERVALPDTPRLTVSTLRRDLTGDDPQSASAGHGAFASLIRPAAQPFPTSLVTASALFDLVSDVWLGRLARAIAREGAAALFALSYDGHISWGKPDPDDEFVRAAVNAHQRGEKGFGTALGPTAGDAIEAAFHSEGYRTTRAPSPWRLGPAEAELTHQLVAGWCTAAAEQRPDEREVITAWGERRRSSIDAGTFELTVGHVDVLALPPG